MPAIGEFMQRFMKLYNAEQYAEALTLVQQEADHYPAHAPLLLCWRAAMQARTGNADGALATLQHAFAQGYWYHEGALRGEPDFAPLHGRADFEALVEQNATRRQEAAAHPPSVLRILEPTTAPEPWPLLIALHGNGGNAGEFADYWQPAVDQGWLVAIPQSTQTSWLSHFYDWNNVPLALEQLEFHYRSLTSRYLVDTNRVILAGFSMGALVAERAALTQKIPARGLVLLDPADDQDLASVLASCRPAGLRAFVLAGNGTPFHEFARDLSEQFKIQGIACHLETVTQDWHGVGPDFPKILPRALNFLRGTGATF